MLEFEHFCKSFIFDQVCKVLQLAVSLFNSFTNTFYWIQIWINRYKNIESMTCWIDRLLIQKGIWLTDTSLRMQLCSLFELFSLFLAFLLRLSKSILFCARFWADCFKSISNFHHVNRLFFSLYKCCTFLHNSSTFLHNFCTFLHKFYTFWAQVLHILAQVLHVLI